MAPPPNRPDFFLPFEAGAKVELKTYDGHNPVDKKIDMYRHGMKTGSPILASADGVVHEWFLPGGIEIRHGDGWFTTYMHMAKRIPRGTKVKRGDWVGVMGSVGTGFPHLHYEQLFNPRSDLNAGNQHLVRPLLQGRGPIALDPGKPITMDSTNGSSARRAKKYFWVDIFDDAPVFESPESIHRTGTLREGRNYVYCKKKGPVIEVGPHHNHWWLKTDPDEGRGHWVSAYYLARWGDNEAKDNDGVTIPDCKS